MTPPVDNQRIRDIHTALGRLGTARIENFFRAARAEGGVRCLAVDFINRDLDAGVDVETALIGDHDDGYSLGVKGRGRKFRIAFGCSPGPMVGDGGTWDVTFDKDGRVLSCHGLEIWIS